MKGYHYQQVKVLGGWVSWEDWQFMLGTWSVRHLLNMWGDMLSRNGCVFPKAAVAFHTYNNSDSSSCCDRDRTFWNQDGSWPTFLSEVPGSFSLPLFIFQSCHSPQPLLFISYLFRCSGKVPQHTQLMEELVWAHSSEAQSIIMGRAWWQKLEAAGHTAPE